MRLIAILLLATFLVVVGYVTFVVSTKSEGRLRDFGKYLSLWVFVLAALVVLGGVATPILQGGRNGGMGMGAMRWHRAMMWHHSPMGMRHHPMMMGFRQGGGGAGMAPRMQGGGRPAAFMGRTMLGVGVEPISAPLATTLKMDGPKGLFVTSVAPDSAAARAGVQQGDVILKFDGKTVNALQDLRSAVADTSAGATVPVAILRGGNETTVQVKF